MVAEVRQRLHRVDARGPAPALLSERQVHAHRPHFHAAAELAGLLIESARLGVADRRVERRDRSEHDHLALGLAELHRLQTVVDGGEVGSVGARLDLGTAQRDWIAFEIDRACSIGHGAPPGVRTRDRLTDYPRQPTPGAVVGIDASKITRGAFDTLEWVPGSPEWRNWQTRRTQNAVSARACGFESRLRHHPFSGAPSRGPQGERA